MTSDDWGSVEIGPLRPRRIRVNMRSLQLPCAECSSALQPKGKLLEMTISSDSVWEVRAQHERGRGSIAVHYYSGGYRSIRTRLHDRKAGRSNYHRMAEPQ